MEAYGSIISERAAHVLEQHKTDDQSIAAARSFLFDMLAPTPERGDMQYRYEHSVRVSQIAGVVARAEGLPEKDLVIACHMMWDIENANVLRILRGIRLLVQILQAYIWKT